MYDGIFGKPVLRALPISKNGRDALGYDLFIRMNAPLSAGEVRELLKARDANEAEIQKLQNQKPEPGIDTVGRISQIEHELKQQNRALVSFFSGVWETSDGEDVLGETVSVLHSIVGTAESRAMMNATLKALEDYQAVTGKGVL